MAEYHVGCGVAAIYAGTCSKPGVWKYKSVVTDEALKAVADYMLGQLEPGDTAFEVTWTNKNTGRTVKLTCSKED